MKPPLEVWKERVCSKCSRNLGCITVFRTMNCLLSFLVLDKFDERLGREIAEALKTSEEQEIRDRLDKEEK